MIELTKKLTKNTAIYTKINPCLWEIIEKHIVSDVGNSGFIDTFKEESHSTISIVLAFDKPGGDRSSAHKRLAALDKASHLALLPSEDLESIAYSQDLKDEWKWQRFWSLLLAKCFLLILLNELENQLEDEVKASHITRWDAEAIERDAYRYEALYRLIKKGFKHLKESLPKDLANKTPWDVFMEICREEIDFHFEIRTSGFQEFLIDTWIPCWEKLAKQEIKRGDDLAPFLETQKFFHSQRLLITLEILIKKAKRDKSLTGRLTTYFNECIEVADWLKDSLRARNSSGRIHKSEQWKDGERSVFHNNRPIKPGDEL